MVALDFRGNSAVQHFTTLVWLHLFCQCKLTEATWKLTWDKDSNGPLLWKWGDTLASTIWIFQLHLNGRKLGSPIGRWKPKISARKRTDWQNTTFNFHPACWMKNLEPCLLALLFFVSLSCLQWSVEPAFLSWHCFDCGEMLGLSDWTRVDVSQGGRRRGRRGRKRRNKKTPSLPSVGWGRHVRNVLCCAVLCERVCVRAYRRSFLLRRKSFLVCAISASLGRGGKTCRETNHGVRDSSCQERRCGWKWMEGKTQQSSCAQLKRKKVFYWKQRNSGGVNRRKHLFVTPLLALVTAVLTQTHWE